MANSSPTVKPISRIKHCSSKPSLITSCSVVFHRSNSYKTRSILLDIVAQDGSSENKSKKSPSPKNKNSLKATALESRRANTLLFKSEKDPDLIALPAVATDDKKKSLLLSEKFDLENASSSLFGKDTNNPIQVVWRLLNPRSKKVRSIILLNILGVVYASNIPVIKATEAVLDPSLFTLLRFSVATVPFLPYMFRAWTDTKVSSAGMELGFWVGAGYLTQGIGLVTADAGRASFISSLTVIVVPFLDGILGTRVSKITWLGAVMATLGIFLLESSGSPATIGDFWNVLSAIFFGIHMLRTQHLSRATKKEKFLALIGYELSIIALLSAVWYFGWNDAFHNLNIGSKGLSLKECWRSLSAIPWIPVIYTGIFSTSFCLWAELAAMKNVAATDAAIIYGLEPVWGASFAWFFLGERWGSMGWLGALLVIGGSLMVQLFESAAEKT